MGTWWRDSASLSLEIGSTSVISVPNGLSVGGGSNVAKILNTATTWDPGSPGNGTSEKESSVTLKAVSAGRILTGALPTIVSSDWVVQASVTASNTVEVKITNNTGGVVDFGSGTLRINT